MACRFSFRRKGDDGEFARSLYRSLTDVDSIRPLFRRKPVQFLSNFAPVRWTEDADVDLEYHVRLLALPKPGRVRELLELTSMLHGTLLDRHRPLWEAYVIEGLADGRVAVYMKTHHALMDGVSAVQAWYRSLSSDPHDRHSMPPWAQRPSSGRVRAGRGLDLQRRLGSVIETVQDVVGVGPAIVNAAASAVKDHVATVAVCCSEIDLQRPDHRSEACRRAVVADRAPAQGQLRCRRDAQRCGVGNVRGCATAIPDRTGRVAGQTVDRDGAGIPSQRRRG